MWEDTLTRWFYFEELGIDFLYGNTINVPQIRSVAVQADRK